MRKFFTIISVALLATILSCSQSNTDSRAAKISFSETIHDFGTIAQNSDATCIFVFKNMGKRSLKIDRVATSCGCTVPDWSREPVERKGTGVVKINYNTEILGDFHKVITVYSNAGNSPVTLEIKGKVVPKDDKQLKK